MILAQNNYLWNVYARIEIEPKIVYSCNNSKLKAYYGS